MKRYSQLSLKSFRKNDIHIISILIYKLKLKILSSIVSSLLNIKLKLLLKINLTLLSNNNFIYGNFHGLLHEVLNTNYFYFDLFYSSKTVRYNVKPLESNMKTFYNFIYDLFSLNYALQYISTIKIKSFSHMPTKRKHITVLRSPHTDKKSREQFTLETYRKSINDEFNILGNIIESTSLLNYSNCQLVYKKLTKIY